MGRMRRIVRVVGILGVFLMFGSIPLHAASNPRAFGNFFNEVIRGDLVIIGNTVLGERWGATAQCSESNVRNGEVDAKIFTNSSATLELPDDSTILRATLYWQGTVTDLSNANEIYLRSPNSTTFHKITSQNDKFNSYEITQDSHARYAYQGVADVKQYVTGSGTYTISKLKTMEGKDKDLTDDSGDSGYHGGWALVVVYESPSETSKRIMLYDGFKEVNPSKTRPIANEEINISGFKLPADSSVDSHLYLFVGGADMRIGQDRLQLNNTPLSNPRTGSTDHLFNSYVPNNLYGGVNEREPECRNSLGTDIHHYNIGANGTNSLQADTAKVTFTSRYHNDSTFHKKVGDVFYPGFLGFTINDAGNQAPNLCYVETFYKGGTKVNQVHMGDLIEARVSIHNRGRHSKAAENLTLKRLKTGGHAPFTYEVNTMKIGSSASSFIRQTDSSGDDLAESLSSHLVFRLGSGASATRGGSLAGEKKSHFAYSFRLQNILMLNSAGGYKVSYTSSFGSIVDETLPPCGTPNTLSIVPASPPKVKILEYNKAWNSDKITTKIAGESINMDIMLDPNAGASEVVTIKQLGVYSYDQGGAPTLVMPIPNGGISLTNTSRHTFILKIPQAYRHLKIHAVLGDDTLALSDSFAVRPERFGLVTEDGHAYHATYLAGRDFAIRFAALDFGHKPTQGYNPNVGLTHVGNPHINTPLAQAPTYSVSIKYQDKKSPARVGDANKACLSGAFTHPDGDDLSIIQAGIATPRSFKDGIHKMIVYYPYVGRITFHISEILGNEWAVIDSDDTPPQARLIPDYDDSHDTRVALREWNFACRDLTLVSKTGGNFAYIENLRAGDSSDMLTLSYLIYAVDTKGNKLKNFRPSCYADNVRVDYFWEKALQNVEDLEIFFTTDGVTDSHALKTLTGGPDQTFMRIEKDFIIGEDKFADDDSYPAEAFKPQRGEAKVELSLGFSAKRDRPINPIRLSDAERKLTIYPAGSIPTRITSNITLMYGRINAINSSLDSSTSVARVYYEVYCKNEGDVKCEDLGLYAEDRSVNSAYWYRRFPDISKLPDLELVAAKLESEQPPTSIMLEGTGNKKHYKLQFALQEGKNTHVRVKHGRGADQIPDYLYFHPYNPHVENKSYTGFNVSRPEKFVETEGIVKAQNTRDKKGASRISR